MQDQPNSLDLISNCQYTSVDNFRSYEDNTSTESFSHFKAVLFRRWIHFKRSKRTFFITFTLTLGFGFLAIIIRWLMLTLLYEQRSDLKINQLSSSSEIVVAKDPFDEKAEAYLRSLALIYKNDTGKLPTFRNFSTREDLNSWIYKNQGHQVLMGVVFNRYYPVWNFTTIHNTSSLGDYDLISRAQTTRMAWKTAHGPDSDITVSVIHLMKKVIDLLYGQAAPFIAAVGLISILPLIVTQPISDIRGEVRSYMVSCSLSIFPYWFATFLIDFLIWTLAVTLDWLLFIICQTPAFLDNKLITWYSLFMMGPSFILFSYCLSFLFQSSAAASRQLFVFLAIAMIIPMIISFARMLAVDPILLCWFYALIPPVSIQRLLNDILSRFSFNTETFSWYWTGLDRTKAYLIMQIIDIPIYMFVLWVIENYRELIHSFQTKRSFSNYLDFFTKKKAKCKSTPEAKEMEDAVARGDSFIVKISQVSRLFFNSEKSPIPAVNNVSLGVKDGSLFGFLGANGAGKTTLIKMITSMLPTSSGTIEIDGKDIAVTRDTTLVSVCPQFNSHLCMEMTPREHFVLYQKIHRLNKIQAKLNADFLIDLLSLTPHADKPVCELSGGNQRKLAVALAFFAPSKIILLDEPTSSLDPVARHEVHELIQRFRGVKTFMLCTHLLSEAESLCDTISIMVKGCVYTCGSPQYLSRKFGTEFKIDILLKSSLNQIPNQNQNEEGNHDDYVESSQKVDRFFADQLPTASLTIDRPGARIYSVPASVISLSALFRIMGNGKAGDNGFSYYTCSTSSLERVFMEIVRMSEDESLDEEENLQPQPL